MLHVSCAFVSEDSKYIDDQDTQPLNRYEVVGEYEGDVQINQQTSKQEQKATLSIQEAQAENVYPIDNVKYEGKDKTKPSSEKTDKNLEKRIQLFNNENKRMTKKSS